MLPLASQIIFLSQIHTASDTTRWEKKNNSYQDIYSKIVQSILSHLRRIIEFSKKRSVVKVKVSQCCDALIKGFIPILKAIKNRSFLNSLNSLNC